MRPYILYDVNEQKTVLRFKYVHTDEHFDYSHCVPADSANAAKERLDALWEKIQAKRANKKKILEKLLATVGPWLSCWLLCSPGLGSRMAYPRYL